MVFLGKGHALILNPPSLGQAQLQLAQMDPFADLMGADLTAPTKRSSAVSQSNVLPPSQPTATAFSFMDSMNSKTTVSSGSSAPTGFSFLDSTPSSSTLHLTQLGAVPGHIVGSAQFSTVPQSTTGSGLDDLLAGIGMQTSGNASLPVLGQNAISGNDFSKFSVSALKAHLQSRGIDHTTAIYKADLVALATKSAGGAAILPDAPQQSMPSARPVPEAKSRSALNAFEIGLPNAFAATGFAAIAPQGAQSSEHDRQYRIAAGSTTVTDVAAFRAAAARLPLAQTHIAPLPPAKLVVRVPACVLDPVVREVTAGHAGAGGSEYAACVSNAPGAAQLADKLLPSIKSISIGPRRLFEIPVRSDVSDALLLLAVMAAGNAAGLDCTHKTQRSLILHQRVSLPSAAFSSFTASPSVCGVPTGGGRGGGVKYPVIVHAGLSAAGAGAAAGGLMQALFKSRTVYVNCVTAFLGMSSSGHRCLLLHGARYAPAGGVAEQGVMGAETKFGRLVEKERVGGPITGAGVGKGGKGGAALAGLLEMSSAGSGVPCSLVHKRAGIRVTYRQDRLHEHGMGKRGTERLPSPEDDPFGTISAHDVDSGEGQGSEGQWDKAAAALRYVPGLAKRVRAEALGGPGLDSPAHTWDADKAGALTSSDIDEIGPEGWQDGSERVVKHGAGEEGVEEGSLPEWSNLRVSFLDADVRSEAAPPKSRAGSVGASTASDLSSLGLGMPAVSSPAEGAASFFSVMDAEDEVVQLCLALAADLRGQRMSADGAWAQAVEVAKRAVAAGRGEVLPEPRGPGPAEMPLAQDGDAAPITPFQVHPDTIAAAEAGYRSAMERHLFPVAQVYDDRSRTDERVQAAIARCLGPVLASAGLKPVPTPLVPSMAGMPLVLTPPDEADTEEEAGSGPRGTGTLIASQDDVPGLTPHERTVRDVYVRAYACMRRLHRACIVACTVKEQMLDIETRARLARKVEHSGLRSGAALLHAAQLVSSLQTRFSSVAPSDKDVKTYDKAEPGRAALVTHFNGAGTGEAVLAHFSFTSSSLGASIGGSGEVLVTPSRICLLTSTLLSRTKKVIPWECIVAVTRSSSILTDAVTITYVDDDKVAAKAAGKKTAPAPIAASAPGAPVPGVSAITGMFAGLSFGAKAATISAPPAAAAVAAPLAPTPAAAPEPDGSAAIHDLFAGMLELGEAPAAQAAPDMMGFGSIAPVPAIAPVQGKASSSTMSAGAGAGLPDGPLLLPGLAEPCSSEDMFVFLSSGGSTDVLSQLSMVVMGVLTGSVVTGPSIDRDSLYCLLQSLRQFDSRPHRTSFSFPPPPSFIPPAGSGPGGLLPAPNMVVPDVHAWLCRQSAEAGMPPPPLPSILWKRDRSAMATLLGEGGAHGKPTAGTGTGDLFDLFAMAPASGARQGQAEGHWEDRGEPNTVGVPASAYDDLASMGGGLAGADEL